VLADPTRVMLYNRGQAYTRAALTPRGDRCEWFSLPAEAVLAARRAHGRADGDEDAPFGAASFAPGSPRMYLLAQAIDRHLAGPGADVDALFVEEATLTLLDHVAASLAELEGRRVRSAPAPAHRRLAAAAERLLATRFAEPGLTLPKLAAELDSSPFHLARVFRQVTGRSLHAWRMALRLRAAVEPLLDGGAEDLTRLALELGFSSHSHFSAAFRATYGVTPSQLPRLPLSRLSTILTA
jgi:AraC-like DNA-binding protein